MTHLKNLENFIGKTLSFGGIVTNVQYRTGKTGKDWAMFTLEGYDESQDFRIFNEDYLKFRHFLVNNQFVYFKISVKDGWVNRETGKKSEPQISFQDAKLLADVLPTFAKKLSVLLNIEDLQPNLIQNLNAVFKANEGINQVTFEVMEIEKITIKAESISVKEVLPMENERDIDIDNLDIETEVEEEEITQQETKEIDQFKVVNSLVMPSKKLKVKISNELLNELERLQVNFKLN